MQYNLTIKTTKNYQSIEISATDIIPEDYEAVKMWLIDEAKLAINQLEPGENITQKINTSSTNTKERYKAQTVKNGKMATENQKKFIKTFNPNYDENLTFDEASAMIDDYFAKHPKRK